MIMSILAIAVVALCGYIWLTRGFLSGLIHLICTLIAGAIAFGFFETVAYNMLGAMEGTSAFGGTSWALALSGVFAVSLIVLRLIVDRILRWNIAVPTGVDYAGGAICGVIAGIISSGILIMSLSSLRMPKDFWMYTPVSFNPSGNPSREGGLMFPVDTITLGLYGHLSERALRVEEPLSRWQPEYNELGATMRLNPYDGAGRNTIKPEEFEIRFAFTVGKGQNVPLSALLVDRWKPEPQGYTLPDGSPPQPGSYILGYLINFKPGSKERDGRTAVGAAQMRLVLESEDGSERMVVYPVAVSSQSDPSTSSGTYRWRYDAPDVFIASVGGGADVPFAFEFVVPPGYSPLALFLKGTRVKIVDTPLATPRHAFDSPIDRDVQIAAGWGLGPAATWQGTYASGGPVQNNVKPSEPPSGFSLTSDMEVLGSGAPAGPNTFQQPPTGVQLTTAVGFTIQLGQHGGLEVDDQNIIQGGKLEDTPERAKTLVVEKKLRIDKFASRADVVMFQIDVTPSGRTSIFGRSIDAALSVAPVYLVDSQGERYQPVGFVYEDQQRVIVSYNPSQPVQAMSQLPQLTRSNPKQKMKLLFHVTFGRDVKYLAVGNSILNEFNPLIQCNQRQ